MSVESAQVFLQLIQVILYSTDDAARQQAVAQVQNQFQNPSSIFSLFMLIPQTQENEMVRRYSILILKQAINQIAPNLSSEELQQIKGLFVQVLTNEPNFLSRRNLCEAINIFATVYWPEVYDFANQLLNNESLSTTGLYLWKLICENLREEQHEQAAPFLIESSRRAMDSSNPEARIYGTQLLGSALWLKYDYSHLIGLLVQSFQNNLQNTFYVNKIEEEAKALVDVISEVLTSPKDYFFNYIGEFSQWAFRAVADVNMPFQLRLLAYRIIDDGDKPSATCKYLLDETNFSIVQRYLETFINFSILLLREDRISDSYDFMERFLHNAGATFEGDIVFDYIWSVCTTLMQDPNVVHRQISLFLLQTIVDTQITAFSTHINEIMDFILGWSENDDEYDYVVFCALLEELARNVSGPLTAFVDAISCSLLKKIAHQKTLSTLDIVLDSSHRPPQDLSGFIQSLLGLLGSANTSPQAEAIFSCLGSSISSFSEPIEEIYPALCPVLNSALQNDDLKVACLRCFGKLAAISPRSLQADIEKHVMLIGQSIQGDYLPVVTEAIRCLQSIATNCILSLVPFCQGVIAQLINILQRHPIRPLKGETDYAEIKLQAAIMTCLATFIKYVPSHLPPLAQEFVNLLRNCIYHNGELYDAICESVAIAAEGYRCLKIDIFDVMKPLVQQLSLKDSKEVIISIHNAVTSITKSYGADFTAVHVDMLKNALLYGLDGMFTQAYLCYELSASIDIQLLEPIFECLDKLIGSLGQNIGVYVPEICQILQRYLTNPNKTYCGYALEIYAHLCFIDPPLMDLYVLTIERCVLFLNENDNRLLQTLITKAIRYLLYANKDGLESYQQTLIDYSESIIKDGIESEALKSSTISLWCSMIMEFGLNPNTEILQMVINSLPPKFDSDELPFAAVFSVYAAKDWPELAANKLPYVAAALISSDDYFITETSESVVAMLAASLDSVPQDQLGQFVQFNQGRQIRLIANLQRFKQNE